MLATSPQPAPAICDQTIEYRVLYTKKKMRNYTPIILLAVHFPFKLETVPVWPWPFVCFGICTDPAFLCGSPSPITSPRRLCAGLS